VVIAACSHHARSLATEAVARTLAIFPQPKIILLNAVEVGPARRSYRRYYLAAAKRR
jgi:hypothetical protein